MGYKADDYFSVDLSTAEMLGYRNTLHSADIAAFHRLYELQSRLSIETNLTVALQEILSVACASTGTDLGCIQLVSEDGKRLEIVVHQGYNDATSPFINFFRYEGFKQGCDAAREQRRRLIIEEVIGFPGLEGTAAGEAALADGIRATQSTPMICHKGLTVGVLSTQFNKPHCPTDEELKMIDVLAWIAADFVETHRTNAVVAADLRDTQLLRSLGERVVTEKNVELLYQEILEAAIILGRADAGSIQLLNEETQELVLKAATGINSHIQKHFHCIYAGSLTSCALALQNNLRTYVDFDDPEANDPDSSLQLYREAGFLSSLSVPLVCRSGKPLGIFSIHWRHHYRLTERELSFLDLLARQIVDTLELRLKEQALCLSQEQLNVLNDQLQRSNQDLQQFAHVTSHDLKEPIRKIKTFSGRIIEDFGEGLPERVQMFLRKIDAAAERMQSMIEGVLEYSKFDNSQKVLQQVDLNEVLRNIELDLEVLIQKKNAVIAFTDLPTIQATDILMYQLFYNLILNSLKFSKAEEPSRINITCAYVQRNQKNFVKIILADNGIGFEQEYATAIFEPFKRLNPKDEYEGTGLGLALCKKIVERLDGSILTKGEPGKGAEFTILLPA
jgi:signal transduction histidine kinase